MHGVDEWVSATTRSSHRLLSRAALCLTVVVGTAFGAPPVAVAAPAADCGWRQTAQQLVGTLQSRSDAQSQQLRALLATALGTATSCVAAATGSGTSARPYFAKAEWLWSPIPADAQFDPQSAAMGKALSSGDHIADLDQFGVALAGPGGISSSTPRFAVSFAQTGWGPDPFGSNEMPIPEGVAVPPGSDGHLSVADPVSGYVYSLWQAKGGDGGWSAGWGGLSALDGDGREEGGGSTGSGLSRFAAVIRADEIAEGSIPHALFFSSNMVTPQEVRYPAAKTDGSNDSGESVTVPEGARVQLDPSVDVDALTGLSPAEKTIAKALQTYGAYVGDNGGARMAFIFEYAPDSSAYADAGLNGDFAQMNGIPWEKLRVLKAWDGGAGGGSQEPGRQEQGDG